MLILAGAREARRGVWRLPSALDNGDREISTESLSEAAMGPLLVWAMRVVDDFADDILTAWSDRQRLVHDAATNLANEQGTNRQIAHELGVSADTAAVHVANILKKLKVGSRSEAAVLLVRLRVFEA